MYNKNITGVDTRHEKWTNLFTRFER